MMMAFRTGDSLTQEELSGILHLRGDVLHFAIPSDRRRGDRYPLRRQYAANEFVEGNILIEGVADPAMKRNAGFGVVFRRLPAIAQDGVPLRRKKVRVVVRGQQAIDQAL